MMMSDYKIDLAEGFSRYPFGRYQGDGEHSAEKFRDDILTPALRNHLHVTVDLGGTNYYGSPFLEETFGGLLRHGFSKAELDEKLTVLHDKLPSVKDEVAAYIKAQSKRNTGKKE